MFIYYNEITELILKKIYDKEEALLERFKTHFVQKEGDWILNSGVMYSINVHRWMDIPKYHLNLHVHEGYTSMLEIDFTFNGKPIISVDGEYDLSVFETLFHISFNPITRKFRVYEIDNFQSVWNEMEEVKYNIKKYLDNP